MTDSGTLAVMPIQRQNELPFRPFHSGSLQLSVYRSTSVDPKRYDASRNYPAVLESFIKRRPLSEVFATPISNLDLSSSSDEDLTDPVPESPLNLSDAESMASGHSSPFSFPRRRKAGGHHDKAKNDTRPRSLYDAAKPHPPPRNAPGKGGKIDPNATISDKLGRLIHRRPWKHYREAKQQDVDARSSYERGTEPVPESRSWTNVVGSNPTQSDEHAKLTPHPPKNPAPAPRKKRQAPKPPTALPRNTSPTDVSLEATPLHAMPGSPAPVVNGTENDKHTDTPTPTNTAGDSLQVITPVEGEIAITSVSGEEPLPPSSDTPTNTSEPFPPVHNAPLSTVLMGETSDVADTTVVGTSFAATPDQADVTMPDVVKETATEATTTPLSSSPLVKDLCATLLSMVTSAEQTESEESEHLGEVESDCRLGTSDAAPYVTTQGEKTVKPQEMTKDGPCAENAAQENTSCVEISANEHFDNDVTDGLVDDTRQNNGDEIVAINLTPAIREDAGSILKHVDPSENASSGYSSPGSGDEGPASPEPVTSPVTLGVPSPTSSYYSTSLSASSSRVSNMSRELTLKTSCGCGEENEKVAKTTTIQNGPHVHHLATDINMNDVPAKRRSQSESVMATSETRSQKTNKNVSPDNETLLPGKSGRKLSDPMLATTEIAAVPPLVGSIGYSTQSVVLRSGSRARVRPRSEFIPSSREREEWKNELNRVSICMVERPGDSAKLASQYPAGLFKAPQPKVKGPSKKKALAAAQKSRAFAMRARVQLSKRHSYAESSDYFVEDEPSSRSEVPSSNLVSHFVSTRNISTYYDGTDQRVVTPQEILTSKREEFFNAFRNTYRHNDQFGGSVQHLPVSTKEFAIQDVIPEVNEIESPVKPVNPIVPESPVSPVSAPEQTSSPVTSPESIKPGYGSENKENEITVHRQSSGASSSGSSANQSSVYAGSTWSLSTEMTTNQSVRMRKPSLRRRLQGAFSFQNIRRAISMEKLSEEEKRRSMSHHYINEAGSHDIGNKSATLAADGRAYSGEERVKKSSSIMNMFPSVRMRKRRSRMNKDARNRYTISGPEELPDNGDVYSKRSSMRPMSLIVPSSQNNKKTDRVGDPSFFRPIGRVLQMNPAEGTLLVEMVKPPSGPFGFYIARKKEAGDTGSVYISRLSDSYPDKMFAGLMRTGDEITEVNGTDVSGLTLDQVYDLILDSDRTLLKIKPSQVHVV